MRSHSIRKMGTKRGEPHYGLTCNMCPVMYGRENILAVAHLSKPAAHELWASHIATDHGRSQEAPA